MTYNNELNDFLLSLSRGRVTVDYTEKMDRYCGCCSGVRAGVARVFFFFFIIISIIVITIIRLSTGRGVRRDKVYASVTWRSLPPSMYCSAEQVPRLLERHSIVCFDVREKRQEKKNTKSITITIAHHYHSLARPRFDVVILLYLTRDRIIYNNNKLTRSYNTVFKLFLSIFRGKHRITVRFWDKTFWV